MIRTGALAIGLIAIAAGCTAQESRKAASEWVGKDRTQLANTMGQPKEAVPMTDTGGEMLFYSYQGHHYVFETNAQGLIDSAVQTK
ncbi:MAG TPA: hypothetical protein VJX23_07230 [Candidatus Binataceae bacterium]|nr:hypothetical protein [Candidatus Binataceae bacterium]